VRRKRRILNVQRPIGVQMSAFRHWTFGGERRTFSSSCKCRNRPTG
jgi:hypothetical protein